MKKHGHPSHAKHNKAVGLPHDVFGSGAKQHVHQGPQYGGGNPTGGSGGEMQGAPQGGGPEGPINGGPSGMHENCSYDGDE